MTSSLQPAAVIETERLRLRPFVAEDVDALAAVLTDPVAMRWYVRPFTRTEVVEWIERNQRRYTTDGYGLWAMVLESTGEVIGDCGLVNMEVDGDTLIEVGYHVRRDHWKRGYATEAARACMKYAFEKLGAERVISLIRPENVPSWRVAEKNGMTVWKETVRVGLVHRVYLKSR
jgi:[ribosomal protein S5]-alanine N-acetyltransferase